MKLERILNSDKYKAEEALNYHEDDRTTDPNTPLVQQKAANREESSTSVLNSVNSPTTNCINFDIQVEESSKMNTFETIF